MKRFPEIPKPSRHTATRKVVLIVARARSAVSTDELLKFLYAKYSDVHATALLGAVCCLFSAAPVLGGLLVFPSHVVRPSRAPALSRSQRDAVAGHA